MKTPEQWFKQLSRLNVESIAEIQRDARESAEDDFIDRLITALESRGVDATNWDGEDDSVNIVADGIAAAIRAQLDQHQHEWKQLRDHMGCDGSDLPQLMAAWDTLLNKLETAQWAYEELRRWAVKACERDQTLPRFPTDSPDSTLPPSDPASRRSSAAD